MANAPFAVEKRRAWRVFDLSRKVFSHVDPIDFCSLGRLSSGEVCDRREKIDSCDDARQHDTVLKFFR